MSNILCTIVVPAFNEENNIKNIFSVLLNQSYKFIEVLFIDDGSTDHTLDIIKKLVLKENEITVRYIKQNNMGAAEARKTGVKNANGNYIAFVDCDDSLSQDAISSAMSYFFSTNGAMVDIALFKLLHVSNSDKVESGIPFRLYTDKPLVSGVDAFCACIDSWGLHGFGIYRKRILLESYASYEKLNNKNINYLNNDEVISRICYSKANLIATNCGGVYFFVNNPNSTVRRVNNNYFKVIYNSEMLFKYICFEFDSSNHLVKKALNLEVGTLWGVVSRYYQWKDIGIDREAWSNGIQYGLKCYRRNILNNIRGVSFKGTIQFFLTCMIIFWK
ncbi:glycosyl transferase family protein [Yersinia aldovae]|uniref:Glycosyl transferase family protein n=1 Tax=Yersinia aldovae TaxID=29483 RepID=A0A0T9UIP6_YERAL|nr:glycosyltransferase family A protein [Yersinia aldovae]CNL44177.1 glycosyl transferase family protein [Yersinia aldovae]